MDALLRKGRRGAEMRTEKRINVEGGQVSELRPGAEMIQERGACETCLRLTLLFLKSKPMLP